MKHLLIVVLLMVGLSGCADATYGVLKNVYGWDCRPEALQGGRCATSK
jgi:hypothetical protein